MKTTPSEMIRVNNAIKALLIAKNEILDSDYEIKNQVYNILCELHNKYLAVSKVEWKSGDFVHIGAGLAD